MPEVGQMGSVEALSSKVTIGLDLGDRSSAVCVLDEADGTILQQAKIATTPAALVGFFEGRASCRVVMEVGTHSPWVSRTLQGLGHDVIVANPSEVYGTRGKRGRRRRKKRNDTLDAQFLARQGRADVKLLHPIRHRGLQAQAHLALLRARDQVVRNRTRLVTHVRGAVKSLGARLGRCSAEAFARRVAGTLPPELNPALEPLVDLIRQSSHQIDAYDRQVEKLIAEHYPEALLLQQVKGVGPVTALAFVLLIEDPSRFDKSRDVGAYFGLVPGLDESGDLQPQMRITKAGDELGRRLLVSAAQYILGPHGPECDLRRHGHAIAARGGKNARKRAAVAVARKLAVLLHRLWVSRRRYDPDRLARRRPAA